MRTVGIIAEYNPFHTGHNYHLETAKKAAKADFSVVVMSPDFVQRGEPAIFGKYTRTRMALLSGADLVLELPVCYASGSAEYFAEGAVALLDKISVVDTLCFGSETADIKSFFSASNVLLNEPEEFLRPLKAFLKQGMTFPQARSAALDSYFAASLPKGPALPGNFLSTPNNILGMEYCKAIKKQSSNIQPLPVLRKGNDYNSTALSGAYCSATALRSAIRQTGPAPQEMENVSYENKEMGLLSYIPAGCCALFREACRYIVSSDDLLPYLAQQLLSRTSFDDILDISSDLSDRIANLRYRCIGKSYEETAALLKTKQMTEARIRRALLHLILGISKDAVEGFRANGTVFYARILGFRKDAAPLLHEIKKKSTLPLITKTSCASSLLNNCGKQMWELDLYASHLYRSIQSAKYRLPFCTEYEISPVIL